MRKWFLKIYGRSGIMEQNSKNYANLGKESLMWGENLMQSYTVRWATSDDLPGIVAIHNQNARVACQGFEQGFLLEPTTIAHLEEALTQNTQFFVAVDGEEKLAGFVRIAQPQIDGGLLAQVDWVDPRFARLVQQKNHRYIQILAVDRDCMGRGVARLLYESIYPRFPGVFFSALIVWQPIQNQRSFRFHQAQGFKEIGRLRAEQFLDLKNYEAIVVGKEVE
ncbi:MAG: GNAT family N-acetyltransferase [Spirulina sp. DLM2.Bin59]|nr:MAG: GNAT family N-acetyltransferase [Spirulina sp. DLM2.Bin59]